jgi:hypothetical protein
VRGPAAARVVDFCEGSPPGTRRAAVGGRGGKTINTDDSTRESFSRSADDAGGLAGAIGRCCRQRSAPASASARPRDDRATLIRDRSSGRRCYPTITKPAGRSQRGDSGPGQERLRESRTSPETRAAELRTCAVDDGDRAGARPAAMLLQREQRAHPRAAEVDSTARSIDRYPWEKPPRARPEAAPRLAKDRPPALRRIDDSRVHGPRLSRSCSSGNSHARIPRPAASTEKTPPDAWNDPTTPATTGASPQGPSSTRVVR